MPTEQELIETDILAFLDQNESKELLRFVTVGSVDDGKSTLIGRLLHDTKGVYDDQLADATRTTETGEEAIDFARLTDGLRAEREQGITIDVAYRYFSTPRRKFIIADTPGHVQYTRNMATGASTASVALILIDARYGVLTQSRRHAYIASLLGIPHLLVCVNKMDLVDYDQARFNEIVAEFNAFADELAFGVASPKRRGGEGQVAGFKSVSFVPVSALMGVNIVETSDRSPWYTGPSVLEFLETVEVSSDRNLEDLRFPVQYVLRPNLDYRGYAGQVASGVVRVGDEITVLPSRKTSRVQGIDTYDGSLEVAYPPMSVVLRLEDEIDISRGDILCHRTHLPYQGRGLDAMIVWMSETPLDPDKSYLIKHATRYVRVNVDEVAWKVDLDTLQQWGAGDQLALNDIGFVRLTAHTPIAFDAYKRNRLTGSFILVDSLTNNTVGAGMIMEPRDQAHLEASVELSADTQVSPTERHGLLGQAGGVVWLTGLPAAGASSLAFALERRLFDLGYLPAVLDPADGRYESATLIGTALDAAQVALRLADAGLLVLCAAHAPLSKDREAAHAVLSRVNPQLVHVSTAAEVCAERDTQGRYDRGAPSYEAPASADLTVDLASGELDAAVEQVIALLIERSLLDER